MLSIKFFIFVLCSASVKRILYTTRIRKLLMLHYMYQMLNNVSCISIQKPTGNDNNSNNVKQFRTGLSNGIMVCCEEQYHIATAREMGDFLVKTLQKLHPIHTNSAVADDNKNKTVSENQYVDIYIYMYMHIYTCTCIHGYINIYIIMYALVRICIYT